MAALRSHTPAKRRAGGVRERTGTRRPVARRRDRRGGPWRLRRPAGRGGRRPGLRDDPADAWPGGFQAADAGGARERVHRRHALGAGLARGCHPAPGGRRPGAARVQRGGHAPRARGVAPAPRVRSHRRFPGPRARHARPGRVEGRSGHGVGGGGLRRGQGDQGPRDGRARRLLPGLRFRPAQGLLHARAHGRAVRLGTVPGAPVFVRQCAAGESPVGDRMAGGEPGPCRGPGPCGRPRAR